MQSHLSENQGEIAWVKELCPDTEFYGEAYDKFGLFGGENCPTIMAHCVYSSDEELELIEKDIFYENLVSAELSSMFIKLKRQLQRKSSGYHDNILRNIRIEIFNNPEKFDDIDDLAKKANF